MREYGQLSPLPLRPTLVPPLQLSRQTVASSGLLLEILIKFFIRALLSPSFSPAYLNRATIQRKQGAHEQQYYYYAVICCNRTTFTRWRDTAERASERAAAGYVNHRPIDRPASQCILISNHNQSSELLCRHRDIDLSLSQFTCFTDKTRAIKSQCSDTLSWVPFKYNNCKICITVVLPYIIWLPHLPYVSHTFNFVCRRNKINILP